VVDNVDITAGTGTTIRTDDVGGVQYPASKLVVGADGVNDGFVSTANPLPVTGTLAVTGPLTDAQLRAVAVPVSGTVATGGLTDTELRAVAVPVSGTITANAGTGTFAVSAASLPLPADAATQTTLATRLAEATFTGRINTLGAKTSANSTPVVLASDQASIPVAATCTGTVAISGSVAVSGPLTDVQIRATALPVSGTVTANAGTGTMAISAASLPLPALAATSTKQPAIGTAGTASADVITIQGIASMTALKVDGSAVTQPVSGTVTTNQGTANTAANRWPVYISDGTNTMPTGDAVARAILHKITDGTNTAAVKAASVAALPADPSLVVAISPNRANTYSASSAAFTPAASATDVFTITGSASKTVRIRSIWLSGTQTTALQFLVLLIKRSTANTTGTSAAVTAVPHDTNSGVAASATVLQYTANPGGLGAAVGNVRSRRVFIPAPATATYAEIAFWDFGVGTGESIVLRGTAQVLAINLNATTLTGGSLLCGVEWTEE
jgi:hypothetical protein